MYSRFNLSDLHGWLTKVLEACNVSMSHAAATARVLLAADLQGIDSHGIARLPAYVRRVRLGFVAVEAEPKILHSTAAVSLVDGGNILGPPAAEFGMHEAIDRAHKYGIGWVTVTNSNHYGIAGYYPRMAIDAGMIGLSGTSAPSLVAPTGSREKDLGTNPIAFGAPSADGRPMLLDMATSAVAGGKFEIAIREGTSVPEGWGLDVDGRNTTDPGRVFGAGGSLLPLGSFPELSSHKGFGLGLMVEILSACLSHSPSGPSIGALTSADPTGTAGVSHFFGVIDPAGFGLKEKFGRDVARLNERVRGLPSVDDHQKVRVPGDRSFESAADRGSSGIPLHSSVIERLRELGQEVGVSMVEPQGSHDLGSRDGATNSSD